MSIFSALFSRHIREKNIKTSDLAQYCGFDRSNMYKIINGKRNPPSKEVVLKMAKFMQLSLAEEEELTEAYQIALTGHDNYFRRKAVLNFFSDFSLTPSALSSFKYSVDSLDSNEETYPLSSPDKVKQALFHIISLEMSAGQNGRIQLLMQPDTPFLIDLISAESQIDMNVHIEQIICLNNSAGTSHSQKNYNLCCLKQILPLYGVCCNYNCFYYYDNVSSKTGNFTLFPYMVITSRYVCLFTADLGKGYMMQSSPAHEMFSGIFSDYLRNSKPLLRHIDTLKDQLTFVENILQKSTSGYCFQMEPCLTPFLSISHIEKYVRSEIPGRDSLVARIRQYSRWLAAKNKKTHIQYIFSLEGVRNFLDTGKIHEYPSELYTAFDLNDRIQLIKELIRACSDSRCRMLKKSVGNADHGLYLFTDRSSGYLMFLSPYNGKPVYLEIDEPELLFSFYDFCENLEEQMFFTQEEAVALLKSLITSSPSDRDTRIQIFKQAAS